MALPLSVCSSISRKISSSIFFNKVDLISPPHLSNAINNALCSGFSILHTFVRNDFLIYFLITSLFIVVGRVILAKSFLARRNLPSSK